MSRGASTHKVARWGVSDATRTLGADVGADAGITVRADEGVEEPMTLVAVTCEEITTLLARRAD
jgi:hypothetical protein